MEASKITNDPKYSILAGKIGKWFSGKNAGLSQIYNPDNGIVFDGINSENNINMNSGAESTIEALLSLLEISNDELASSTYLSK